MLLAIDVGNTHTVFALCENQVHGVWRMATDGQRTEDEYAAQLLLLMQQAGLDVNKISGAILSSVVPDTIFPLRQLCAKYFACEALVVGKDPLKLDMTVKIDNPAELGADRLVNAVAAWHDYREPLIVIDLGTATTFDVVNARGEYIGGAIAPGVNVSLGALQKAAAKLHGVVIRQPERVIGTCTTSAMQSGIYYGYMGLIEGIVQGIKQEYGAPMKVIATGGLAELFARESRLIDAVDGNLTMRGLQLIYEQNAASAQLRQA